MRPQLLGLSKIEVKGGKFRVVKNDFKKNKRSTGNTELFFDKDDGFYVIRKGMFRTNCVVDNLSEQNLIGIYNKIGKMFKIKGHQKVRRSDY